MMVVLWTDALLWLVFALGLGYGLYAARRPHLRAPWRRVVRSRTALAAAVVLAAYAVVGLLDSIHLRAGPRDQGPYAGEVVSLLDRLLTPLRVHQEKTYAAPFALHLYARETVQGPDGRPLRTWPRLRWAPEGVDEAHKAGHILRLALKGVLWGLMAWLAFWGLLAAALARVRRATFGGTARRLVRGGDPVPWPTLLGTAALVLVVAGVLAAWAPHYHVLGTDKVGEDVLYQALKSVRTGIVIGTLTTLVMLPAAILLGIAAGYFRGWVDDVIQYVYTTLSSIPGVLLIAAAVLMLQIYMSNHPGEFDSLVRRADLRLLFLCLILGITSWTTLCRLLRGETLKLRDQDYVQAAHAFGVAHFTIIARHILPNVLHIVLITLVLDFSGLVLAEAVLSYVNIGVDPTMNSWGNMINGARLELAREPMVWWSLAAAFLFMFGLVLAANLLSDVVQAAFDPRTRGARR